MASNNAKPHGRTTAVGLLDSPKTMMYLGLTQRLTSFVFTGYVAIHLVNTCIVPIATSSMPASEPYLDLARKFYHIPLVEIGLIVLPISMHFISGVSLRLLRYRQNRARQAREAEVKDAGKVAVPNGNGVSTTTEKEVSPIRTRSLWPPLSWISIFGYSFAFILLPHLHIHRLLPLLVEGTSANAGLGLVSHLFAKHPGLGLFLYLGVVITGVGHMTWGWAKWTGQSISVREIRNGQARLDGRRTRFWATHVIAVLVGWFWAMGGVGVIAATGGLGSGWRAAVYDRILAAFWL